MLLIDKHNMHLYPEDVQKILNERLSSAFSAERPYSDEVVSYIKTKFKEWD
jgi:predicted ATP-binding protein involved in virulence